MMAKRFLFETPDQLKEAAAFCAEGSAAKVMNVARIWNAEKRKKERTPWDGKIGVSFYTEERKRMACVFRFSTGGELCTIGWLKYNAALRWCEEHLKRLEQGDAD